MGYSMLSNQDLQYKGLNYSVSKVAFIDRKSFYDMPGNLSRITIIELFDPPVATPTNPCELLKGIFLMTFSIFALALSGILVKWHYDYNPLVTTTDMVFVRAFSQLVMSYVIAVREKINLTDIPP